MSAPRFPKRVEFVQSFVLGSRSISKWPDDKHRDVACRVIGDRVQLLDKARGELVEVPASIAVCCYALEAEFEAEK